MKPISFQVGIEFASDFADILSVKAHDFALGDPMQAPPLPPTVPAEYDEDENQFLLTDVDGARRGRRSSSRSEATSGTTR